jgi:adenylosuccinate lyase
MFFATLGVIASSIERLATEVRHMQRTEVLEAEEFFSPGQKGSSAMPHKRNPVLTENLTGLARLVRAAMPAMENVALWHERDISHSSVERGSARTPPSPSTSRCAAWPASSTSCWSTPKHADNMNKPRAGA